jgi:chromosome segregation ATPase
MTRLSRRSAHDIRAVDRAATRIEEQSVILERHLAAEGRAEEQLRHLRHATGLITRSANDGVQAYRRASTAIRAETEREDADLDEIKRATEDLRRARARMLAALEVAGRHYPTAAVDDPADPDGLPGPGAG